MSWATGADGASPTEEPALTSSVFEGETTPEDPAGQGDGVAAQTTPCLGQRTALLQDNVPWLRGNTTLDPSGLGANAVELEAQGNDFCVVGSWQLGTIDLRQFTRIVISSAQSQTFYDRLFPAGRIRSDVEDFVAGGGTLIANLADNASGPGNGGQWNDRTFVGGVRKSLRYSEDNDIAVEAAAHPIITGDLPCLSLNCGQIRDLESLLRVDVDRWNYASHGHFTGLPAGATRVISDGAGPALVTYPHGQGHVVASMLTTEWRYLGGFASYTQNQALVANLLAYQHRAECTEDSDCDGLSTTTELGLGTSPTRSDTDGDGLLDPWEVESSVPGAGFRESYPDGPLLGITRDEVFGPYGGPCNFPDKHLRVEDEMSCFNQPPDPLHKDMYFELDWQDCQVDDCPEVLTKKVDPIHHAPNIVGLGYVSSMFWDAPVSNPDNKQGVNLNVLVDERIAHSVNCDQDTSAQRDEHFGTEDQRRHPSADDIREARSRAVRYIWSGHSSYSEGGCPNPNMISFGATGFGLRNMEKYDFSPFGDVNLGGEDLLVTLGPIWSCPAIVGVRGTNPGPCYDATEIVGGWFGRQSAIFRPGIFPTRIETPTGDIAAPYPVARLLGMTEQWGGVQLWERTLAHLIGHSLGIQSDSAVGNRPDVVGSGAAGSRTPVASTWYSHVGTGLRYAPNGAGRSTLREDLPAYVSLANGDADGDGTPEGKDNCPGLPNPDQENSDIDNFGDACDGDVDGDGRIEGRDREGLAAAEVVAHAEMDAADVTPLDEFPYDTDNDGSRNDDDVDDDGDGVLDGADLCPLLSDPGQVDTDGDREGDACDRDDDGDGALDVAEEYGGSLPLDPGSLWELLGDGATCTDGVDNDRDGASDGADVGCVDGDGDGQPDLVDGCPRTSSTNHWDYDGDGLGDVCDETPYGSTAAELWMADGEDVFASATTGGTAEQLDPSDLGAIATAVDTEKRQVWTYGDGRLRSLSQDGKQLVDVAVPGATDNEQKASVTIGVRGDVWVATKRALARFDASGRLMSRRTVDRDIVAVSLDRARETVWVATDTGVTAYSAALVAGPAVAVGKPTDVAAGDDGTVWVTVGSEVRGYRQGGLAASVDIGRKAGVVEQAHGRLWVAAHDGLAVVDPANRRYQLVDGFPASSGPKVVDIEPDADGVWVADNGRARFIGTDLSLGQVLALPTAGTLERSLRDIAVLATGAPEDEPEGLGVLILSPGAGRATRGEPMTVRGTLSEPAQVTVNGVTAVVGEDLEYEAELPGLAEGATTITVTATSPTGERATASVDVTVDRTPPAGPAVTSLTRSSVNLVSVAGTSEPGAVVVVRNATLGEDVQATLRADDLGRWSTALLAAPGHAVSVTARDAAGNVSPVTSAVSP